MMGTKVNENERVNNLPGEMRSVKIGKMKKK